MLHEPRQFWSLLKNWTCILYRCSNTTYVWQEVFRKLLTFDLILFRRNFFVRIKEGFLLFLVKPICLKWEISPSLLWRVWHFSYWKFSIFFSHSLFGLFPQFDASYVLWRFSSTWERANCIFNLREFLCMNSVLPIYPHVYEL